MKNSYLRVFSFNSIQHVQGYGADLYKWQSHTLYIYPMLGAHGPEWLTRIRVA